jgi:hypothetical protein
VYSCLLRGRCPTLGVKVKMICDVAQAVSHWLRTAAARVRARVRSCGICGGPSGTGAGFLRVLRFPLPLIPWIAPNSSLSFTIRVWYSRPVIASVIVVSVTLHDSNKSKFYLEDILSSPLSSLPLPSTRLDSDSDSDVESNRAKTPFSIMSFAVKILEARSLQFPESWEIYFKFHSPKWLLATFQADIHVLEKQPVSIFRFCTCGFRMCPCNIGTLQV